MSKLKEYLKLIPKGIANIDKVVEGWVNSFKMDLDALPEDEKDVIIERRLICQYCPYMSENAKEKGYKTDRHDAHCTMCGCPILQKTASLSSNCGIETYNLTHPDNPLPLKWTAYDKSEKR